MNTRLIILTSRKNYAWVSMEEIISWIEKSWEKWAKERRISYKIINVDNTRLAQMAQDAITSELIVVTCFNTTITSFLYSLREKFFINTPWVFYLHSLASYGAWPLFHWKIGYSLNTKDVFIGSCTRDKKQFELIFKNIECKIIPFSLEQRTFLNKKFTNERRKLAFIGRISSQKNLHSLILSLSFLKHVWGDSDWEMHFFGMEDNYGSPLMGKRETGHQAYLENLAIDLKINEQVHFHGFVQRMEIEKMLESERWTFISPSMHSDENFGMAAFRCLLNGHKAILSDWGGHSDFLIKFSDSVTLLPVYKSTIGPFISIKEMAYAIKEANKENLPKTNVLTDPEYYSEKSIHSKLNELWEKSLKESPYQAAETTQLLEDILKRRELFLQQDPLSEGIQIYENYKDLLKDVFFDVYGQRDYHNLSSDTEILTCPWVKETEAFYEVNDPHRGKFSLPKPQNLISLGLAWHK